MTTFLREREVPAVWWAMVVQCQSALRRRHRETPLPSGILDSALRRLDRFLKDWDTVPPTEEVRRRAGRLLSVHSLRAGDALQLGAALVFAEDEQGVGFVCLDDRLRDAASKEGFWILPD